MRVFRLSSGRFAADNGKGASEYGGRWNRKGTALVYTSANRPLAVPEVLVHHGAIPADYRFTSFEIPEGLTIETVPLENLPQGWPDEKAESFDAAAFGSAWAQSRRTAVLCVPSVVIRGECNYLLNPLHTDFAAIRFETEDAKEIDERLIRR